MRVATLLSFYLWIRGMPWFRGRTDSFVRRGAPRRPRRGLEPHVTLSDTELPSTRELGGTAGQRNNFSMNSVCFRKAFGVEKLLKQLPAIPQPAGGKVCKVEIPPDGSVNNLAPTFLGQPLSPSRQHFRRPGWYWH